MAHVLRLSMDRNSNGRCADLLSLSASKGIVPKVFDDASQVRSGDELSKYFLVRPGLFVVNPMWVMHGSLSRAALSGVISPDYRVYVPTNDVDVRYLHYLLKMPEYLDLYALMARGTTTYDRRISKDDFNQLPVLLPPLTMQRAIADFLDRKTSAIDALIEKKQKLLDLLAEKRAALINQAVTKGLDSNVPMKHSGIPWIGEIPAHWDVKRLKFMVTHVVDCHHSTPTYDVGSRYPALRTADVHPGFLDVDNARRVNKDEYLHRIARLRPEAGDVVYSREGERYGIAAPIPPHVDVCLAQRVMLFRTAEGFDPAFFMWALNADCTYQQMRQFVVGATSPHVNIRDIREAWLPAPPVDEQVSASRYVSRSLVEQRTLDPNQAPDEQTPGLCVAGS